MTTDPRPNRPRPPKRNDTSIADVKRLLTAASVAATLGGWALFSQGAFSAGADAGAAEAAAVPVIPSQPAAAPSAVAGAVNRPAAPVGAVSASGQSQAVRPAPPTTVQPAPAAQRPRPVARTRSSR